MLHLYDVNKNKIAPLTNIKDVRVERELNGDSSLLFSYPITGRYYDEIVEESYIRTKENEYIVKEIHELDEWTEYKCLLNVEDLEGKPFSHFEMVNSRIEDTINTALAGTGWTVGYCDVTKRRTVRKAMCSSWDIIQDARKVYRCDITFDTLNKKVNIYSKLGEDKGAYFTDELNLRRLEIQRDSYNFCTRIIPIGKDGMTIKDVNNGKEYVENHQYSNKIITKYWEDNRYTVQENLRDDAQAKVDEMSKPYISYKADVIDLASISNVYNVLDYNLGDTITLMNKRFKVKEKQRIVKIVEWLYEPERNTVEIANRTASFEDMQRNFEDTSDMVDSVTTSDGMIDDSKVDFNPIRQEFEHVIAQKADIVDLNAANARIGNLEVTKANITDLDVINARIDNLYTEDLSAINAEIINLQARVGEIDTILAMEVFAELIEVGEIRAGSGIIADGAIGDAQISYLTAGKIVSGTIDTSLVTVAGTDGKLNITGNRLQVINDGLERVALGDVNRDGSVYGLRVRGEDGETVLFDERGITREGITEGSIDDSKVGDDANIQGYKLDINSVIREVNDVGIETIKGTRVQVGDRTLDVELSTLKSNIDSIEIGGRNLIRGNPNNEPTLVKVNDSYYKQYSTDVVLELGQTYTFSWDYDIHFTNQTLYIGVGTGENYYAIDIKAMIPIENGEVTFTVEEKHLEKGNKFHCRLSRSSKPNTSEVEYKNIKLEKGNKATDWTPAPEDFTAEITHQRALIQALDEKILLKVDRQEFTQYKSTTDENIGLINTQLIKNTSSIDILQEQIKLKVEQVDIENAIADMEIGGRNLLLGTSAEYETRTFNGWGTYPYTSFSAEGLEGENIIVKAYLKPEVFPISLQFVFYLKEGGTRGSGAGNFIEPGEEGYVVKKAIVPKGTESIRVQLRHDQKHIDYNTVHFKEVKAEKGTKATDWTPAPEDVDAEFTNIRTQLAEINIDLNSITSRVQETEYDLTNVTNKVTILEQTAEDFSISIRKYEDGIFEGATYTFDGQNATFKGAGLKIQNDFGTDVLYGDTDGNLTLQGNLTTYQDRKKAIETKGNRIFLYDAESTTRVDPISTIYTGQRNHDPTRPTLSFAHEKDVHFTFLYRNQDDTAYNTYLNLDAYNKTVGDSDYFIKLMENTQFLRYAKFNENIMIDKFARFSSQNSIATNHDSGALRIFANAGDGAGLSILSSSANRVLDWAGGQTWQIWLRRNTRLSGDLHVEGSLNVAGSKNAVVTTKNYGEVLINSYETAEYYNGDLGSGKLGKDGLLYVYIDDIFDETINTFMNYHITYGKCGPGEIYTYKKYPHYFIVKGTPGLKFTWELKAKRDGYEYDRLETPTNIEDEEEINIEYLIEDEEEKETDEELEEIVEEELMFDLADYVLGGDE